MTLRQSRFLSFVTSTLLTCIVLLLPVVSHAVPMMDPDVTILFDKVKVTARAGAGADAGFILYSAQPTGDGPYKTKNGAAAIDFFKQKPDQSMPMFLNGFTGAAIVANQFEFRYFGSVAADKGSILRNLTNIRFKNVAGETETVPGKAIEDFEIKLARPDLDKIVDAKGGNAFPTVSDITKDNKGVTFSGGNILNMDFPAVGGMGEFLWSIITPDAPQPKFPLVFFTEAKIPPDPAGDFKDMRYVGRASAVPESATLILLGSGIAWLSGVAWRQHRRTTGAAKHLSPNARSE